MEAFSGLFNCECTKRDVDEIRRALRAERFSYSGYLYGSPLILWPSTMFPDSVDKAVTQHDRVGEVSEQLAIFE